MHLTKEDKIDSALKTCKRAFYYTVFFGFIVSLLTLITSIYSLEVFDRVLSSGSIETLTSLTIIMIVFSLMTNFVQGVRTSILHHISNFLDQKLASTIISVSFSSLKADSSKPEISQNINDLNVIKNFITSHTLASVIDSPWALIYITAIFAIHPILGILVIAGSLILLFLALANNIFTKNDLSKVSDIGAKSAKELEIISRNTEVVEAMAMKKMLISNWQETNQKIIALKNVVSFKSNIIGNCTKFFRSGIYVATVATGAILVLSHKMSPGGIIACSILSTKALLPFDSAISLWSSFISTRKSYQRLKKLLHENDKDEERLTLPDPLGKVEIERISFVVPIAPKIQKPIIKGINITINPGEIIAIIGPTASGKSTLAKLILGIYKPSTGHIRFDGSEILNWDKEQLGKHIGYLPQDIELFSGSVKDNIARMNKNANDADIIRAAQMSCAHQMILKLPKAYETDIGAWGTNISSGQRQRIALARAFYGNPKLLILDEPNSNLDLEGEKSLISALKNAKKKEITTLIISHRNNILKAVDKILVLNEGEAKLFGPTLDVINTLRGKSNA